MSTSGPFDTNATQAFDNGASAATEPEATGPTELTMDDFVSAMETNEHEDFERAADYEEYPGATETDSMFDKDAVADADPIEQLAAIRGWSPEALQSLGCKPGERNNIPIVKFPMRNTDGDAIGWKRRRADDKPFDKELKTKSMTSSGGRTGLFFAPPLPEAGGQILIAEGEADTAVIGTAGATSPIGGNVPSRRSASGESASWQHTATRQDARGRIGLVGCCTTGPPTL